jgi:transposase
LRYLTVQHIGDRVRHLHQAIDLTFPEFTQYVGGLDTELATSILSRYPTARSFREVTIRKLANLCFDGRRCVGKNLARDLIEAATRSVGRHQTQPYEQQVRYACQDIVTMRVIAKEIEADIQLRLDAHAVGRLFTAIPGISTVTAATIIAETGDPARFRSAAAFASYVGVVPRLHHSGKRNYSGKGIMPLGNARLRRALWMPVLVATRLNPWLRTYYQRLRAAGKRAKVAMIATMHKLLTAIYSIAVHRRPFVLQLSP